MSQSPERVRSFLKTVTSFTILESGIGLSLRGAVLESSRTGSRVRGIVKDEDDTHSVTLEILSSHSIEAECSCCSKDDMLEFWCRHAVALLWSAYDLGFLEKESGFDAGESTLRLNMSSPQDIATVMRDLSVIEYSHSVAIDYHPAVTVQLDTSSDRLGVQILFDGEVQGPAVFEAGARTSTRALDNILLRMLDDEGSWDEARKVWFVNSSRSIETVLGIIQEYEKVVQIRDPKTKIVFSREFLDAHLIIKWRDTTTEISMKWVLPNNELCDRETDLLGTGPFWVMVGDTLYRLSAPAAKISSIFPYNKPISLPRTQVAPILEELHSGVLSSNFLKIENEHLQPKTEIRDPNPKLSLAARDNRGEHFVSSERLEIDAVLEFDYPAPPKSENIVYLPDRVKEQEYLDFLKSTGFVSTVEKGKLFVVGDDALDIVHDGEKLFPKPWRVSGLGALKEKVRFSELSLNVNISEAQSKGAKKGAAHWFDCHITLSQNNSNIPISVFFKPSRLSSEKYIKLDSGAFARVPGGTLSFLKTTLGMVDPGFKLSNTIKARLGTAQAVSLGRIDDASFKLVLDSRLRDIQTKLSEFKAIKPVHASAGFKGKLRHYQEDGLSWLSFLEECDLGGILADEMGLGKTVQTLAFLHHLKRDAKAKRKPTLIVAPTSVITNWFYEVKRFVPDLTCLLLHGPSRKVYFKDIPKHDVVLTSYALLRLDKADLEKNEFDYVILDEAQNIKNPQAAVTKAAKSLRARRRLVLTGTPTENRPVELWSLMDFVMPGYLGSEEFFKSYIEKPILEGTADSQVTKFLNQKTRPFILRRAKAEVEKDLPPKIESVVHVEMSASQSQLYGQVLEEVRPKVLEAVKEKGVGGASVSILAALLRLRQICNHPNSIESLKELPGFESGKFSLLKDLVTEALDSNRKILVFSQFREMLAIIRRWLEAEKVNHLYLDGTTKNRQELIDEFNHNEKVRLFLISLKAGGTGLNLTAADTVIIYDPWWNPAVENQAVDRAHRIGQTKAVSVYRLVTEQSIEQKIMDLKSKKAKIVDALINDNGLSTLKLTKADIENLFSPWEKN